MFQTRRISAFDIMGIFKFTKHHVTTVNDSGQAYRIIRKKKYYSFEPSILGLGEIITQASPVNAISAIFDLAGFTNFCKQIDPQLVVPRYLSLFLNWIFKELRERNIHKSYKGGYRTWSELPFFSKFLGDGLLFMWNSDDMSEVSICNLVITLQEICENYSLKLLPKIKSEIPEPPGVLRCGIARGIVYSVGNGEDFVGPCINMSARLQKMSQLTFCFSRRGFNCKSEYFRNNIIIKKVTIRGIGENELVGILKEEFENLSEKEKEFFRDPKQ